MIKFFALLILANPSTDGGKDSSYVKYEKEKVANYRAVPQFVMPEVGDSESNAVTADNRPLSPDSMGVFFPKPYQLEKLNTVYRRQHCDANSAQGFRIQIYAGSDLNNANKIRADFILTFRETPIHLDWDAPTFKVKAGDYISRTEAMKHLAEIRQMFPDAFVVPDEILLQKRKNIVNDPDSQGAEDHSNGMD